MKSLKIKAYEWITLLCEQHSFINHENTIKNYPFYFKLEGFADEPEVFIRTSIEGLDFGYEAIKWDGPVPSPLPGIFLKHSLSWESLKSMSVKEQQETIHDLLMKTINSRKRQYRKCQFCGEKVPVEHRFDKDTCHGCASVEFSVIY